MLCSICNKTFTCDSSSGKCWCMEFPPVLDVDLFLNGCMCESCLTDRIQEKIHAYVAGITPQNASESCAKDLPKSSRLKKEIDYYVENELYVFTAWFHLKRGECCKNGCRHCPYGFKK